MAVTSLNIDGPHSATYTKDVADTVAKQSEYSIMPRLIRPLWTTRPMLPTGSAQ
jgi:hypothetical protein